MRRLLGRNSQQLPFLRIGISPSKTERIPMDTENDHCDDEYEYDPDRWDPTTGECMICESKKCTCTPVGVYK